MPTMEPAQNEWLDIYRIGHCQLFFLWTVIDPIYILTADKLIASGYDAHNRYVVKIGEL